MATLATGAVALIGARAGYAINGGGRNNVLGH